MGRPQLRAGRRTQLQPGDRVTWSQVQSGGRGAPLATPAVVVRIDGDRAAIVVAVHLHGAWRLQQRNVSTARLIPRSHPASELDALWAAREIQP